MRILITGCNSFLSKEICNSFLNSKHDLIATNRTVLDVSSKEEVDNFFLNFKVDAVIHTAISGGKRNDNDTFSDFINNLKMFENLIQNSDKFKVLINFGSGAEFNRPNGVINASEEEILNFVPLDYYGIAKNLISKKIRESDENFFNFRLFGCFGKFEKEDRFIKGSVNRILKGEAPIIHQNKVMDFFAADDVCKVIDYYLENYDKKVLTRDLNLCYTEKVELKEVIKKIYKIMIIKPKIKVLEGGFSPEYTGCADNLNSLNLKLQGLDSSLEKVIKDFCNAKTN